MRMGILPVVVPVESSANGAAVSGGKFLAEAAKIGNNLVPSSVSIRETPT